MKLSVKNHKRIVRVKFRSFVLSIVHIVPSSSQANNVSGLTFWNPTSIIGIKSYVVTVSDVLPCQKIWDVTYRHHVERDQFRPDHSLANVERPTLERTISNDISAKQLGDRKVTTTTQFRLAQATETILTTRMVCGILDRVISHAAISWILWLLFAVQKRCSDVSWNPACLTPLRRDLSGSTGGVLIEDFPASSNRISLNMSLQLVHIW